MNDLDRLEEHLVASVLPDFDAARFIRALVAVARIADPVFSYAIERGALDDDQISALGDSLNDLQGVCDALSGEIG